MLTDDRESFDEEGAIVRVLEYEDDPTDRIVLRIPLENPVIQCSCYSDDELVYQNVFEERDMSFKPISVRGRGESEHMTGVSDNNTRRKRADSDDDSMPETLQYALNAAGFAIVPNGREWYDA